MGFYAKHIFPHLVDHFLSSPQVMRARMEVLAHATGEVLEIGFGTGLNIECYPASILRITAIDPSQPMMKKADSRIRKSRISVDLHALSAEALPYPSERFDSVISTWTMCSIPQIEQALGEVRRVLRNDGRFVFLEHGLSPDKSVQQWQKTLRPLFRIAGGGCHPDRDIQGLIDGQGFAFERLKCFYLQDTPRIAGYLYSGVAVKR
jgi:ubiquinone/menaquinone biosynthesis C-methylase UbiE